MGQTVLEMTGIKKSFAGIYASNTLHPITTYFKFIFALYWLYLPFLTTTSHKNPCS